jgi:hypothetical protein
MKARLIIANPHQGGDIEVELSLPWTFLPPFGTTIRLDAKDSDGSDCVFVNISGYDIHGDIDREGHATMEKSVFIFADFDVHRSSPGIKDLNNWLELKPAQTEG